MKPKLEFKRGRNGRGVQVTLRGEHVAGLSYMDAAQALFGLKDFLQASDTGRRCIDDVHRQRQGLEHGT